MKKRNSGLKLKTHGGVRIVTRTSFSSKNSQLVQRVLMPKTRCYVYYFHDQEQSVIEVHSVWGARKERGPKL